MEISATVGSGYPSDHGANQMMSKTYAYLLLILSLNSVAEAQPVFSASDSSLVHRLYAAGDSIWIGRGLFKKHVRETALYFQPNQRHVTTAEMLGMVSNSDTSLIDVQTETRIPEVAAPIVVRGTCDIASKASLVSVGLVGTRSIEYANGSPWETWRLHSTSFGIDSLVFYTAHLDRDGYTIVTFKGCLYKGNRHDSILMIADYSRRNYYTLELMDEDRGYAVGYILDTLAHVVSDAEPVTWRGKPSPSWIDWSGPVLSFNKSDSTVHIETFCTMCHEYLFLDGYRTVCSANADSGCYWGTYTTNDARVQPPGFKGWFHLWRRPGSFQGVDYLH